MATFHMSGNTLGAKELLNIILSSGANISWHVFTSAKCITSCPEDRDGFNFFMHPSTRSSSVTIKQGKSLKDADGRTMEFLLWRALYSDKTCHAISEEG